MVNDHSFNCHRRAKIIDEYVNTRNVLTLPAAIKKMTSQSAKILGLSDRGVLQAGKK